MYNILWIDDQHETPEMIQFKIEADNEGLFLEGYTSFEEGFSALDRKVEYFDVILLDGLFFEKKEQEAGTEDEIGIGMAIAKINEFKNRKIFPWFVLSGKDKFTKGENSLLIGNKAKCFDKTNPDDVVRLFEEIRLAAKEQPDIQLKHKYANVLEACSDTLLGEEKYATIFTFIKHIENIEKLTNTEDMLTSIRKVLERMFTRMAECEIIPEAIISNPGWMNGSSRFLADDHSDYAHLSEFIPPLVSENIYRLLNITQDGSHSDGKLKLKVDQYLKNTQSDFLYRSCVFLLFDLLLWFKDFIEKNPHKDINRTRWKINDDWITGSVSQINPNGWGTFKPDDESFTIGIRPDKVAANHLKEGDSIQVTTKPSSDGTKIYIKNIKRGI